MALKSFKPITPSLRQLVIVDRKELYKGKPVKALTEGLRALCLWGALQVAAQTTAAIAHELNQPLNAVASYCEAAQRLLGAGPAGREALAPPGPAHQRGDSHRSQA